MTSILARIADLAMRLWRREPVSLAIIAGVVLDIALEVVPILDDRWQHWAQGVVTILAVIAGRARVTPITSGGDPGPE